MQIKEFLNTVCEQIKYKPIRNSISEELENHIEESKENYIRDGLEEKEAEEKAIVQMGNAEEIGKVACGLGAGRVRKEDSIDYTVGIILNKKVADKVTMGEVLGYIHANSQEKYKETERKLAEIIKISDNKIEKEPTIFGICK